MVPVTVEENEVGVSDALEFDGILLRKPLWR